LLQFNCKVLLYAPPWSIEAVDVQIHSFLTSALDGVKVQISITGNVFLRKWLLYRLVRRL